MKHLLIALLLSFGPITAQAAPANLQTRIVDDEYTLSIQIDGNVNGRQIHYSQIFDVAGMSYLRKDLLKFHAFNSVGASLPLGEMSRLIFTALGIVAVLLSLFIVGRQRIKLLDKRSN